ncbi:Uma2 family endonuclease [Roseofilum reptotaenium CS-1145]|nr:Uma2 family endonuclease [Roseofilum reptotaenium]MDB9517013.1 Uma2 family endonuclease [Roseofilum reptotaenium CS-1145]
MTITLLQVKNLSKFLKCPETKPASEYINGEIIQKPMPKGKHSRLQLRLCNAINEQAEPDKIAYAFPELRCSFRDRSPEWLTGSDRPQTLAGLELDLTIEQIFGWLKLN